MDSTAEAYHLKGSDIDAIASYSPSSVSRDAEDRQIEVDEGVTLEAIVTKIFVAGRNTRLDLRKNTSAAVANGHFYVTMLLLQQGTGSYGLIRVDGRTPLQIASRAGHADIA